MYLEHLDINSYDYAAKYARILPRKGLKKPQARFYYREPGLYLPLSCVITLVTNTFFGDGSSLDGGTTAAVNTTGATLLVLWAAFESATPPAISDSKTNSWTSDGSGFANSGVGQVRGRIWYVANPTVGASHTFTAFASFSACSFCVAAFSGVTLTSPLDGNTGTTTDAATSRTAGSITPTVNDEVLVTGLAFDLATSRTINLSYSITNNVDAVGGGGTYYGSALAYFVQTTAAAINPTWSWTTTSAAVARHASFKPAATGTTWPGYQSPFGWH